MICLHCPEFSRDKPCFIWRNRLCQIIGTVRARFGHRAARQYGNRYLLQYADGASDTVEATQFHQGAKPVPEALHPLKIQSEKVR
jgi:hypothetical protein